MTFMMPSNVMAVNPARAGMILFPPQCKIHTRGKPRASGDDPRIFPAHAMILR